MQDIESNIYKQRFKANNCCVIIPTYNNSKSIIKIIKDVGEYCADIFVVNDGSTDETCRLISENFSSINLHDVSYIKNKGKGFALRTGFKAAYLKGFKYAITIDADGQHYASDLIKFLDALEKKLSLVTDSENHGTIIIGSRNLQNKGQSKSSNFANNFSNFWFKLETGKRISDTQSGYRLYFLESIVYRKWFSNKYEFELEILVRSSWKGIAIEEIPIDVYYAPVTERVTHFRPFLDFFRISVLNTVLVFLALLYFRPLLAYTKFKKKGLRDSLKKEFSKKEYSNFMLSASVGFGLFMGVFPIWGYQLILGLTLAHLMKLNKVIFFISANISIPPMIPIILYSSLSIGSLLLGNHINFFTSNINWEFIKQNLMQYIIGAVSLSFILGLIGTGVTYLILNRIRK